MADICKGCVYYRPLSGGEPTLCCHYALDNERLRDCPAENCEKKLTLEEAMKKLTQEDKQEIIRLRMEQNVPAKTIAEKFHVSKSAIFNIVSEWKKHGNSAISEDEKKPDTVAPVTDSEQEICVEVPADIIPENAGNVKPVIPEAVREACRIQIAYINDVIAKEQAIIDKWTAEKKEIEDFLEENKE